MTKKSEQKIPACLSAQCIKRVLHGNVLALQYAFVWSTSEEGFEYWNRIQHIGVLDEEAQYKLGRLLALCPSYPDTSPDPGLPSEAAVAKLMGCGVAWRDAGKVIEALREAYAIDFPAEAREK